MKELIKGILKGDNGEYSSKRFVGVLGGLSLIMYMFIYPSEYANSSVLIMALGALGITGIEKMNLKSKV